MFRDRAEELARLEAELLAAEEEPEETPEAEDYEEEYDDYEVCEEEYDDPEEYLEDEEDAQPPVTQGYDIYNTDVSDEDLETYAQEFRAPKRGGCATFLVILLCILTLGVLGFVLLVLRQRGLL